MVGPEVSLRRIAILGGSGGIGGALARALAAPGREIRLAARHLPALEAVAEECRRTGARVLCDPVDLEVEGAAAGWIRSVLAEGPLDLLIVASGLFGGRPGPGAPVPEQLTRRLLAVNLTEVICLTEAAVAAGGVGRIVLLGSLAARDPLPDAPGYSASKAGLACYARAMQAALDGGPVRLMLVEPGHVATAQTRQHRGALPFLLSPEEAAQRILQGLAQGRAHLAFPRRAAWSLALVNALPPALRRRLMRGQRFSVDNGPEGRMRGERRWHG